MQTEQSEVTSLSPEPMYAPTTQSEVFKVVIVGLVVGLLVPLLTMALSTYFIVPVFCQGGADTLGLCSSGGVVANHIVAVIVAVAAFAFLNQWGIYRALVLVFGATLAMWGLQKYAAGLVTGPWLEYYLLSALLYGLAYLSFYWLLRVKHFVASAVLSGALAIGACVVMVTA